MRLRPLCVVTISLGLVATGCGDRSPSEYSDETEEQFMASCVPSLGESERDVCRCAYDEIRGQLSFEEFQELDEQLRDDPDAELPDDVVDLVAACAADPDRSSDGTTTTTEP
jgi:hypothetical protein